MLKCGQEQADERARHPDQHHLAQPWMRRRRAHPTPHALQPRPAIPGEAQAGTLAPREAFPSCIAGLPLPSTVRFEADPLQIAGQPECPYLAGRTRRDAARAGSMCPLGDRVGPCWR